MKNIEQILKDAGVELTEEQKTSVNKAVSENYKTIVDYDKQKKKLEAMETDRDSYKEQLDTANATLEKFKDMDPERINQEIEGYKQAVKDAETKAQKQIAERDQKDYLKGEFDKLGITSERTRRSLMADIMGENGLKWKDGAFMGLGDYLSKENEKDHFYLTDEEKAEQEKKNNAASNTPKFTDRAEGKPNPSGDKPLFNFGFNPIREIKKG